MWNFLLQNLQMLCALVIVYLLAFGANTLLGAANTVITPGFVFDKEKLWKGIRKGIVVLIGSLIVTVLISILPTVLEQFNIDGSYIEGISVVAMALPVLTTSIAYVKDAIAKIFALLNVKATVKEEPKEEESAQ